MLRNPTSDRQDSRNQGMNRFVSASRQARLPIRRPFTTQEALQISMFSGPTAALLHEVHGNQSSNNTEDNEGEGQLVSAKSTRVQRMQPYASNGTLYFPRAQVNPSGPSNPSITTQVIESPRVRSLPPAFSSLQRSLRNVPSPSMTKSMPQGSLVPYSSPNTAMQTNFVSSSAPQAIASMASQRGRQQGNQSIEGDQDNLVLFPVRRSLAVPQVKASLKPMEQSKQGNVMLGTLQRGFGFPNHVAIQGRTQTTNATGQGTQNLISTPSIVTSSQNSQTVKAIPSQNLIRSVEGRAPVNNASSGLHPGQSISVIEPHFPTFCTAAQGGTQNMAALSHAPSPVVTPAETPVIQQVGQVGSFPSQNCTMQGMAGNQFWGSPSDNLITSGAQVSPLLAQSFPVPLNHVKSAAVQRQQISSVVGNQQPQVVGMRMQNEMPNARQFQACDTVNPEVQVVDRFDGKEMSLNTMNMDIPFRGPYMKPVYQTARHTPVVPTISRDVPANRQSYGSILVQSSLNRRAPNIPVEHVFPKNQNSKERAIPVHSSPNRQATGVSVEPQLRQKRRNLTEQPPQRQIRDANVVIQGQNDILEFLEPGANLLPDLPQDESFSTQPFTSRQPVQGSLCPSPDGNDNLEDMDAHNTAATQGIAADKLPCRVTNGPNSDEVDNFEYPYPYEPDPIKTAPNTPVRCARQVTDSSTLACENSDHMKLIDDLINGTIASMEDNRKMSSPRVTVCNDNAAERETVQNKPEKEQYDNEQYANRAVLNGLNRNAANSSGSESLGRLALPKGSFESPQTPKPEQETKSPEEAVEAYFNYDWSRLTPPERRKRRLIVLKRKRLPASQRKIVKSLRNKEHQIDFRSLTDSEVNELSKRYKRRPLRSSKSKKLRNRIVAQNNRDRMRKLLGLLEKENQKLQTLLIQQAARVERLEAENARLKEKIAKLQPSDPIIQADQEGLGDTEDSDEELVEECDLMEDEVQPLLGAMTD